MIFQHARFQIWNQSQHPFQHDNSDFFYGNPSAPGVTNVGSALDYLFAVIYPNSKPAVATPAALPAVGNTINDFRVVNDDGDGKAAAYRFEQRQGEASPSWHKVADVDWGTDSILQEWQNRTQDLFLLRYGYDDLDNTGTPIAGTYAGARWYGGKSASTNLTLTANSGDGAGPFTGYVQTDNTFRPTSNAALSLGTTANRWLKGWINEVQAGTLNLQSGSITDSGGTVSFGSTNLSTSGSGTFGSLLLAGGSITDSSGTINFDNENLVTTGSVTAASFSGGTGSFAAGTTVANFTFTNGNIASGSATVDFNALNLTTTGNFNGGQLNVDNLRLDGNTLSSTNLNGNIILAANGLGSVTSANPFALTGAFTLTGADAAVVNGKLTVSGTGGLIDIDNLRLDANTLSTTNTNGDLILSPNGSGQVDFTSTMYPGTSATFDLGKSGKLWANLYLSNGLTDGTNSFLISELLALRSANFRDAARTQPAQAGDALFFNGTLWLASVPDSEIVHNTLSGLTTGDAGHTQFALLAGRSGGQSLIGGTGASDNLNLESTSNGTKGFVQTKDTFRPFTDASFSVTWSGKDLGGSSNRFRHVYTAGEFFGFRAENVGVLPSSSASSPGRLVFYTVDGSLYVDTGTSLTAVGTQASITDTVWDGVTTVKNVTVSGPDARNRNWMIHDNTNDFEPIYCSIKATSSTNVRITVGTALTAGTYRLIGN